MAADPYSALSLRRTSDGTEVAIRAGPGAKRNAVTGLWGSALRVQIAAPAREGRANRLLRRYLAECFGLRERDVIIRHGEKGRDKRVLLRGLTPEMVRARLAELAQEENSR